MKEIGEYLRDLRESHGVSTQEAAEDLNVTPDDLINLEDGITRAFKDIFILKELVRNYSKYLGADVNKIMDEFSDFMFEKTSKISLEDIKEIRQEDNKNNEKKVSSPYTQIPSRKINYKPLILCAILTIVVLTIIYWIFMIATEQPPKTEELSSKKGGYYEYTNQINSI